VPQLARAPGGRLEGENAAISGSDGNGAVLEHGWRGALGAEIETPQNRAARINGDQLAIRTRPQHQTIGQHGGARRQVVAVGGMLVDAPQVGTSLRIECVQHAAVARRIDRAVRSDNRSGRHIALELAAPAQLAGPGTSRR
jgi:hypothetical protein